MKLIRFAAMLAVLSFMGACGSDAKLPRLPVDARILAFGDSLTFGWGASPEQSYPAVLQGLIGREVVNAGVSGEITAEGLKRLPELLDEYRPGLLILCHGANDLLRNLGEQQASDNIRAMIREARDRGIDVVLIAVPRPSLLLSLPKLYTEIAEEFGLPLEAKALSRIIGDSTLKSDSVHPNAEGYRKLADAVAAALKKAGAI